MPKGKVNFYKLAPTWLYHISGKSKLFMKQEEVDAAWEEGGWGPPGSPGKVKVEPSLLSDAEWTPKELKALVEDDPRYEGFSVSTQKKVKTLIVELLEFEDVNEIQ